jgi:hypothetical protein
MVWPIVACQASGVIGEILLVYFMSELKREIGEAMESVRTKNFINIRINGSQELVECI